MSDDCEERRPVTDLIPLVEHLADIDMGREMFEASPDGQAWVAEIRARIEALPDGQTGSPRRPGA